MQRTQIGSGSCFREQHLFGAAMFLDSQCFSASSSWWAEKCRSEKMALLDTHITNALIPVTASFGSLSDSSHRGETVAELGDRNKSYYLRCVQETKGEGQG